MTLAASPISIPATKSVTILGCTGSVGQNALTLLRQHKARFSVAALSAHGNVEALIKLAHEFQPEFVAIGREALYEDLKKGLSGTRIRHACGEAGLVEAAALKSDLVLAAIVGAAGLAPTLAAVRRGATVGLANKECLVCAGDVIMRDARLYNAQLVPVDSEHSAIFQLFDFAKPDTVEKIVLTASGGPFRGWTKSAMQNVTPQQAVKHPNWSMGAKISVDSATLMNKGLEVIEAYHLFPVREEQIEVVVHPESIIHGMVAYHDGSVLAHMGAPDMLTPIAYALGYPERIDAPTRRLDWTNLPSLTFQAPDMDNFPALRIARDALKTGGTAPCILNAANEVAVEDFLKGKIGFLQIPVIIEETLRRVPVGKADHIDEVIAADRESRLIAAQISEQRRG